jgi:hypothetical protein
MIIKGKILSLTQNEWGYQIVVRQNKKSNYYPLALSLNKSFEPIIKEFNISAGCTIKAEFDIVSKKYNDKYYTSLIAKSIKLISEADLLVDLETGEVIE